MYQYTYRLAHTLAHVCLCVCESIEGVFGGMLILENDTRCSFGIRVCVCVCGVVHVCGWF